MSGTARPAAPRRARWVWVVVLVTGVLLFLADRQAIIATGNPMLAPSLLLLGALVVPVTFVSWVDVRNPVYDVPVGVLLVCGLLGGVIGTVVASILESDSAHRWGGVPTVLVGVIEEGAKLLVPIGFLLFTRYRGNVADGLLIGVAVGTGFAVLETLGYGFVALVASGGDLQATEDVLLVRGLLSPAAHLAWTGLAAAALWHAHARRWSLRAVALVLATFVLVVALHAATDAVSGWPAVLAVATVSMLLLLGVTHREMVLGRRAARAGREAPA